ncbi:HNH endonuclease [Romboutsia sp. 1001216sp1]|uniref:HNH endonuclease n=1 Tax=unclassified Romboutsia TaxID=2626894 RepID=UPI001FAE6B37|nr:MULTISPECIES: HNH endonuclease [unclassified Romboutsia]MDB8790674.1 HNH endonuclease [Romboutsia sp. 1001216sp1]MDB8803237.1 HNH endonuclease [Romboutsia sp. 1001216sp1]MDB8814599.1 HNH endonuclease [Romboutsia sp. 1001216sp1]
MEKRIEVIVKKLEEQGKPEATIRGCEGIFKLLHKAEIQKQKHLAEFSRDEIIEVIESKRVSSSRTIYNIVAYVNLVIQTFNINMEKIVTNEIDSKKMLVNEAEGYFIRQEIQDICNKLENPQDKFIIYAIFNGICGVEVINLRNLKRDDIDMKKKRIYSKGLTINMDNFMYDICKDLLSTDEYYAPGKTYLLNKENPYAIRPIPAGKNINGVGAYSTNGIKNKIAKIGKLLNEKISTVNLVRSNILTDLAEKGKIFTLAEMTEYLKSNNYNLDPYQTLKIYEKKYMNEKNNKSNETIESYSENELILYDDESINDSLYEGNRESVLVNKYERNKSARKKCINRYGTRCSICKFDFKEKYGEIGTDFIHVHHIVPLNTIGKDYVVDPEKDLIPVCPNCHAMLHKIDNLNYRENIKYLKELLIKNENI